MDATLWKKNSIITPNFSTKVLISPLSTYGETLFPTRIECLATTRYTPSVTSHVRSFPVWPDVFSTKFANEIHGELRIPLKLLTDNLAIIFISKIILQSCLLKTAMVRVATSLNAHTELAVLLPITWLMQGVTMKRPSIPLPIITGILMEIVLRDGLIVTDTKIGPGNDLTHTRTSVMLTKFGTK